MPGRGFTLVSQPHEYSVIEKVLNQQLQNQEFPYLRRAHRTVFAGEKGQERTRVGFG